MGRNVEAGLRASRAMLGIVARSVSPALEQVSLPHFRVLVLLETGGPVRMTTLADRLGAVVSTFSRSLDRLEAGGWIRRSQGESDRREVTVSVTALGSALVREVTAQRESALRSALAAIPADDRAALDRAFTAFADAVGEPGLSDMLVLGI